MSEQKPHPAHWVARRDVTATPAEAAKTEQFAHMTYGLLVKHFGLGTIHTFSSWGDLPELERMTWSSAFAEALAEMSEKQCVEPQGQPPAH